MATPKTIEIPESVLISAQRLDDLKDWLASNDPEFLDRIRSIRRGEDLPETGSDLSELIKRWPIGS
jgi:hypothetical protein